MNNSKKVILIGSGAVGTSFMCNAISRNIASQYEIIDVFKEVAEGNVLDFEDSIATSKHSFTIKQGTYKSCKDADLIVITAGRPQKPDETRLDLMIDNARIMRTIALEIKKSGFKGITLIASNPVDIMTSVYQKTTGYHYSKVISSGTSLDSARLRCEIAKYINVSPRSISAYVMGEHGDSSVSVFSSTTVNGVELKKFEKDKLIDPKKYPEIHKIVYTKAYEIIKRKRMTCYGVGSALADLSETILNDYNEVKAVGAYLTGEYGHNDVYVGVPAILGANGIKKVLEVELNTKEKEQFNKSAKLLKQSTKDVLKGISK